jgi:transposase-like protein
MAAAPTPVTCPTCSASLPPKHCGSPSCPWWRCTGCKLTFDAKGRGFVR